MNRMMTPGFSLIELLVSLTLATIIMASLTGVVSTSLQVQNNSQVRNDLSQQASYAMGRMTTAVRESRRLILPLNDNPNTNWSEHIRQQSIPPAPPEGDSTFASAVLALTMNPYLDLDGDGWADANRDKDFLDINNNSIRDANEPERIDEDPWGDGSDDGAPGIIGIDDNGDGTIDNSSATYAFADDDEDDDYDEDSELNSDEDNDGSLGEDVDLDQNGDGAPGLLGVDDDYDGNIDEGSSYDDDEDGLSHEDSYDCVVYYLNGNNLIERLPANKDINNDTYIDGLDFTETIIAEQVSYFRVERIVSDSGAVLVDLVLQLTHSGDEVRLHSQVRLEAGL